MPKRKRRGKPGSHGGPGGGAGDGGGRADRQPAPPADDVPTPDVPHDPPPGRFHHAYNYIPTADRSDDGELRDAAPEPHDRLDHDLWSGRIGVRMTTVTPLLLPELDRADLLPQDGEPRTGGPGTAAGRAGAPEHRSYRTARRADADGVERVRVDGSAVKGMLRFWYEAATNSRMAVFTERERLGYRVTTSYALTLRPALVNVAVEKITLCPGLEADPTTPASYTVRVPRFVAGPPPAYAGEPLYWHRHGLAHGTKVDAWVEYHGRVRGDGLWYVLDARPADHRTPFPEPPLHPEHPRLTRACVTGYLHVMNRGVEPKANERLFIIGLHPRHTDTRVRCEGRRTETTAFRELWAEFTALIAHDRAQHRGARRDEIWGRRQPDRPWKYLADKPGQTAWSRYLYDVARTAPGTAPCEGAPVLNAAEIASQGRDVLTGDGPVSCYAEMDGLMIKRLVPVQVTRIRYGASPYDLLPERLRPAEDRTLLSPADRVFGWVEQREADADDEIDVRQADVAAWAARLRVGPVVGPAIAAHPLHVAPVPLEILASPKPSQGRFSMGVPVAELNGAPAPLAGNAERGSFFQPGRQPRGRKVYPHDRRRAADRSYWRPGNDADANVAREYRRVGDTRDQQNITMLDWVRAGQEFTFTLDVRNVSGVELGALLWLLDPARIGTEALPGHLKLGAGKPLGFGSVKVELVEERTDLRTGREWAEDIAAFGVTAPSRAAWKGLAERFDEIAGTEVGPTVLSALRRAAAGYDDDLPMHYPRPRRLRDPAGIDPETGKNMVFAWFGTNENGKTDAQPLPLLGQTNEPTLGYQPGAAPGETP